MRLGTSWPEAKNSTRLPDHVEQSPGAPKSGRRERTRLPMTVTDISRKLPVRTYDLQREDRKLEMALAPLLLHLGLLVGSELHCVGRCSRTLRTGGIYMGKAKGKAKAKSSSAGGFGAPKAPPPTLDEVCASFPNRLPKDTSVCCPCGTAESYENCCLPYHVGDAAAETPEMCLRTRYSAFCYRLPKYIIQSTAKSNRDWSADKVKWARRLHKEQMFDAFEFKQLEVGESEGGQSEREALLSMRVTLQPIDERTRLPTQAEPMVFSERSTFTRSS